MKKLHVAVCALALLATQHAFAENSEKVHTETTYEKDGKGIERTAKTERTSDPKGLGNKSWSEDSVKAKMKMDGESSETAKHRSVDAAGTAHKVDESVERDVDADGSVETTSEKKIVTDPKGLMNKSKSKVERTVEEHADGTTTTTKKIDGKTVESTTR